MFRWHTPLLIAFALAPLGCKREEIQVYQAPKDAPTPATAVASPHGDGQAPSAMAKPPWVVPAGWSEKPNSGGMRIASYGVTAADGRSVDISVVPLGGQSGGELENLNRWRGQIGLGPVAEADLAAQSQPVPIGTLAGKLFEMVGDKPTLEGKYKARTAAAILSLSGTTVFFKMTGEDALVTENKPKFLEWLKTVQTGAGGAMEPTAASASPTPIPPMVSSSTAGVPPPPATGVPQWEPPAHWKAGGPRPMRLASFTVPGADNKEADLSISALGGAAGGLLANINRWRTQQLGLAAATEADLPKLSSEVPVTGGSATVVDFAGDGELKGTRMLAAIVARNDRTWFFKLTGPEAVVGAEKENFVKFLKSVKF